MPSQTKERSRQTWKSYRWSMTSIWGQHRRIQLNATKCAGGHPEHHPLSTRNSGRKYGRRHPVAQAVACGCRRSHLGRNSRRFPGWRVRTSRRYSMYMSRRNRVWSVLSQMCKAARWNKRRKRSPRRTRRTWSLGIPRPNCSCCCHTPRSYWC